MLCLNFQPFIYQFLNCSFACIFSAENSIIQTVLLKWWNTAIPNLNKSHYLHKVQFYFITTCCLIRKKCTRVRLSIGCSIPSFPPILISLVQCMVWGSFSPEKKEKQKQNNTINAMRTACKLLKELDNFSLIFHFFFLQKVEIFIPSESYTYVVTAWSIDDLQLQSCSVRAVHSHFQYALYIFEFLLSEYLKKNCVN